MAVYLDYNASTPVDERVLRHMMEIYRTGFGNADSRTHIFGTKAKEIVASSRKTISEILNIDSADLVFTSGATESNNIAILGLLEYAKKNDQTHFITTAIEHKSVLEAMRFLETHGCTVDYVRPDEGGRIKTEQIMELVTDKTLLVSMMHVNSETGIIQPIEEVGSALAETPTYFHIDATQGFGKLNDAIRKTPYNMISFTSHKVGGPQGVGALVLRRDKHYQRPPITPLMFGGQQERGYRPGTTPVALVAGFALASKLHDQESNIISEACLRVKQSLLNAVSSLDYEINGNLDYCLPSTINISFKGVDAEGIFLAMKEEFAFSNGSACNSGSHAPSYVLSAMGLSERRISEAIRISWNQNTNVDFSLLVNYIRSMTE